MQRPLADKPLRFNPAIFLIGGGGGLLKGKACTDKPRIIDDLKNQRSCYSVHSPIWSIASSCAWTPVQTALGALTGCSSQGLYTHFSIYADLIYAFFFLELRGHTFVIYADLFFF
jgi:hypothetical protein